MQLRPFIYIILFVLVACKNSQTTDKQVFRYNVTEGIASMDPAFAKNQSIIWAVKQVYNTLVEPDNQLNIRPCLAKDWEVAEDRKTFIFHLRTDVYFHDNEAFTGGKGRL